MTASNSKTEKMQWKLVRVAAKRPTATVKELQVFLESAGCFVHVTAIFHLGVSVTREKVYFSLVETEELVKVERIKTSSFRSLGWAGWCPADALAIWQTWNIFAKMSGQISRSNTERKQWGSWAIWLGLKSVILWFSTYLANVYEKAWLVFTLVFMRLGLTWTWTSIGTSTPLWLIVWMRPGLRYLMWQGQCEQMHANLIELSQVTCSKIYFSSRGARAC